MEKYFKYFVIAAFLCSFGFLFVSDTKQEGATGIINYYYYKGQKFYFQERTDVVFVKFDRNMSENDARTILSRYPQLDVSRSQVRTDVDNFIKLQSNLTASEYTSLLSNMKQDENFVNVGYAYSPMGVNDDKTYYGMNDYLILQFKQSFSRPQIDEINSRNGVEIVQRIDVTGGETYLAKVTQSSQRNAMEMSNKYYEDGLVNYSEPSLYVTNVTCDTVNDEFYPQQWSLRNVGNNVPTNPPGVIADADMDVDSAWNITKGDSNIVIAILDTGVDTTHPDLRFVYGYDFANMDGNANDDGNHGTACAGIVAAIGNNTIGVSGVAYRCKIMPIKILNAAGSIPGYHVAALGMIWSYQNGASVLSCSWGFVGGASSLLENSINDAARFGRNGKGSVICMASGNENTSPMRFPAISPTVEQVVVGGLTPCNTRKNPSDGCSGETWGACFGPTLDIVAPCVKIYTTDRVGSVGYTTTNYTNSFNGTSSATPNAAGVFALLFSANPNLTRKEAEALISLSAEKVGGYSYTTAKEYGMWNNEMGYGRINARLSLALMSSLFDRVNPDIFHDNPVLSSPDTTARLLKAIIKDNKMLVTAGANRPRVYYRVNGGSFNVINPASNVLDTFNFIIPGQTSGSTVDYYLAAQDTAGTPNVATLPAGGSGASPPGTVAPAAFFTYKVGKYRVQNSITAPKICPNNSTIFDTITISGVPENVIDVDITINISNRDDQDVDLFLLKGASQSELTTDNGAANDSYVNTIFDDEAATSITSGTAPFTGRFRPETPLSVFDGQSANGDWILRYTDDAATGFNSSLDSWSIEITYGTATGITQTLTIPSKFILAQNYPNPFNPTTNITYGLPKNSFVKLTLYDINGREIALLVNQHQAAGMYEYSLDATAYSLSSGIYFYKIEAGGFSMVQKMVLVK